MRSSTYRQTRSGHLILFEFMDLWVIAVRSPDTTQVACQLCGKSVSTAAPKAKGTIWSRRCGECRNLPLEVLLHRRCFGPLRSMGRRVA